MNKEGPTKIVNFHDPRGRVLVLGRDHIEEMHCLFGILFVYNIFSLLIILYVLDVIHPCVLDNGNCSQLCVPGDGLDYFCDCYRGYGLVGDGKTCAGNIY